MWPRYREQAAGNFASPCWALYQGWIAVMSRTFWISFMGFGLYFGLLLVPKAYPGMNATAIALLLQLSALVVMPSLLILAMWCVGAFAVAKFRRLPVDGKLLSAGRVALAGVSMLATFLALGAIIPRALPSGSYDEPFNREAWLDPFSKPYIPGEATSRQRMLADVIARLPHKSRSELEVMLGPSMDTPYFKSTGRDLIYVTGPQRDSLLAMDSEWLLIWLDEDGIYQRYAIATD